MFGDLMFSEIPFATFDSETPKPYTRSWVSECVNDTTWTEEEKNVLSVKECDKWQ